MFRKIFIITVITFIPFFANAEKITDVVIDGNSRVSEETIFIYGKINKGDEVSEMKINEITKNLYSTDFFSDVNVKFENSVLYISLKEYPLVNQLVIVGEKTKKLKEQIIKLIKTKKNRSYINSNISKDIELIKSLYASIGFNFTKVELNQKNR